MIEPRKEFPSGNWSPILNRFKPGVLEAEKAKDPNQRSGNLISAMSKAQVGQHCEKVSLGCKNCGAEVRNLRNGTGLKYTRESRDLVETYLDQGALHEPRGWRVQRHIWVQDDSDLFGPWVEKKWIDEVINAIRLARNHTFYLSTKYPERAVEWGIDSRFAGKNVQQILPHNLHIGVSVENQETADQRIPPLQKLNARMRFVLYEPALEAVDFSAHLNRSSFERLHWLIIGGEYGGDWFSPARKFHLEWALQAHTQGREHGVACYLRQLGALPYYENVRLNLSRRNGDDPHEWPAVARRVREFPFTEAKFMKVRRNRIEQAARTAQYEARKVQEAVAEPVEEVEPGVTTNVYSDGYQHDQPEPAREPEPEVKDVDTALESDSETVEEIAELHNDRVGELDGIDTGDQQTTMDGPPPEPEPDIALVLVEEPEEIPAPPPVEPAAEDEDEDEGEDEGEDDTRIEQQNFDAGLDGNGNLIYSSQAHGDQEKKSLILMVGAYFVVEGEARTWDDAKWSKYCSGVNRDGVTKKFVFPVGMSAHNIVGELRSHGMRVQPGRDVAELIHIYIGFDMKKRYRFAYKTGWQNDEFRVYVLPDEAFFVGESSEGMIWRGFTKHLYKVKGTLGEWRQNVVSLARGNHYPVSAMLTGFASLFVRPTNTQPYIEHMWGTSKDGKSTTAMVGGSLFGGGGKKGFADTFSMTANAFEDIGMSHSDGMAVLDEISEIRKGDDLFRLGYLMVNGQVKARKNDKTTGDSFTLLGITNGEKSFPDQLAELGKSTMPGQEARIVSLHADAGKGKGSFHDLHHIDLLPVDPKKKVQTFGGLLQTACLTYYGTAFREFMRIIVRDFDANVRLVKEHQRTFAARIVPEGAPAVVHHVAQGMALKYAVGQLPAFREVTGLSSEEAENAVLFTWSKFLESVGPGPAPSVGAGIAQAKALCRAHPEYRVMLRGKPVYRFGTGEFETVVCKDHDHIAIAMALRSRDVLICDPKRLQKKVNIPGQGSSWCYVIKAIFADED